MQHALATQLEERIIQLKDYEILDNTIIFGIATINTVFFYILDASSNNYNEYHWECLWYNDYILLISIDDNDIIQTWLDNGDKNNDDPADTDNCYHGNGIFGNN